MSQLERIKSYMYMHIPAIHGLGIIIAFASGLSLLMLSVAFPYSAFSYNKTENFSDYSLSLSNATPLISDEASLLTGRQEAVGVNNDDLKNTYFIYSTLKNQKTSTGGNVDTTLGKGIIFSGNNTLNTPRYTSIQGNITHPKNLQTDSIAISNSSPKSQIIINTPVAPKVSDTKKQTGVSNNTLITLPKKYSELLSEYTLRVNKDTNYFLENNVWYGYKYSKYKNFGKDAPLSISMLKEYGLHPETTLLAISGDTIYFVSEYEKVKLVSESVISGVSNKNRFLEQVLRDQKYIELDSDTILEKLKSETLRITAGKTKSQKISAIYDYVLTSIEYPEVFNTSNGKILSGISSYNNKIGSCGGYVNTFLYMLSFAGIEELRG